MKNHILLRFLTLLLILKLTASTNFDYYRLAVQWPAGICAVPRTCPLPIPSYFSLHGFWPANYDNSPVILPPVDENTVRFNQFYNFQPLYRALQTFWPQLYNPSYPWRFWWHEWRDHGRLILPPIQYFYLALGAYNAQPNPLASLSYQGIVPSNTLSTNASIIQQALGGRPTLRCKKNPDPATNNYILTEIYFCFARTYPPSPSPCSFASLGTCGGPQGKVVLRRP
ncbi:Intracellular ribonuclease LX [Linum grandiflorum]